MLHYKSYLLFVTHPGARTQRRACTTCCDLTVLQACYVLSVSQQAGHF